MRACAVLVSAALVCACQHGESDAPRDRPTQAPSPTPAPSPAPAPAPAPSPDTAGDEAAAYARDIDRMCRVEELADVAGQPDVSPTLATALWLSSNLETDAAKQFMLRVNQLPAAQRADAYDREAAQVGLKTGCPTARKWDAKKQR